MTLAFARATEVCRLFFLAPKTLTEQISFLPWFLHLDVMKLVCLMHIEYYFLWFYVSVGVCDKICSGVGCRLAPVFIRPLWSLKVRLKNLSIKILVLFFSPKSLDLNSYMRVVVRECDDFLFACYVLTTSPKANQKFSFTWCSDLRVTANQIIFHTFWEKSRGLHARLATENHRRFFPAWEEGAALHKLSL